MRKNQLTEQERKDYEKEFNWRVCDMCGKTFTDHSLAYYHYARHARNDGTT